MGTSVRLIHRIAEKAFGPAPTECRYLDLGTQQIFCATPEDCRSFITYCRGSAHITPEIERASSDLAERSWQANKPQCAELFALVGWHYEAIDMTPEASIKADLNDYHVASESCGTFDIVANFGTTEHVFNQVSCFRAIHEATKRGGVMVHFLPFQGYLYHCLYRYDPKFFLLLAEANGYKVIHAALFGEAAIGKIDARHTTWADHHTVADTSYRNVLAEFILQKQNNSEFRMPYDMKCDDPDIAVSFDPPCSSLRL
jgi:hypothetical protein